MTIPIKIIKKQEYNKKYEKPKQELVWDSIAKTWKTYVVKKIPVVEEFSKNKKGRVIDLGCGTGRNMIKNKNIEYYGIDFSKGQLIHAEKYAKKNKIKARFFKLEAYDLGEFKDKMFDYGLFIATLHCLETKNLREKALKEFYRVLKPEAEALISIWNSEDKRFNHVKNHGDIYMSWLEDNIPYMRYYYLYKKQEFLELLKEVGFEVLEFYNSREKDRFSKKNWIVRVKKC